MRLKTSHLKGGLPILVFSFDALTFPEIFAKIGIVMKSDRFGME
jgi:hypothetical protein